MAKHILKCPKCGKYSLKDKCNICSSKTVDPKPPKYSPEDKYAKFRREAKSEEYNKKGYI